MSEVPPEACMAAVRAAVDGWPPAGGKALRDYVQAILEAAAPHFAAAERRRIHEASFDPDDEVRLGLFKLAAADGALAERDRIAAVIAGMRDELADHARQSASLPATSRTLAARAETLGDLLGRIGSDGQ